MRTEKVSFYSEGVKISGDIYLPDRDDGKPWPGIVQGPGFLGLKDAKHYAMMFEKLCAAGYACLCFDYRGWGASEGDKRGWVMPQWQVEDIEGLLMAGTPADIARDTKRYEEAGLNHIVFDLRFRYADWYQQIDLLGQEVLPKVRA